MATSIAYLEILASKVTDELVVTTIGRTAKEWHFLKPGKGNFYRVYMSGTCSFALGLALALPHRRVIALDGDGSLLMALHVLPTIGYKNPSNLLVIVLDNETYEQSTGNTVPTFTKSSADMTQIARGAGIASAQTVSELVGFERAIDNAFKEKGTSFIVAKVKLPSPEAVVAPPNLIHPLENKLGFIRYIEKTEEKRIIKLLKS